MNKSQHIADLARLSAQIRPAIARAAQPTATADDLAGLHTLTTMMNAAARDLVLAQARAAAEAQALKSLPDGDAA
jgi:hypothetical protein